MLDAVSDLVISMWLTVTDDEFSTFTLSQFYFKKKTSPGAPRKRFIRLSSDE